MPLSITSIKIMTFRIIIHSILTLINMTLKVTAFSIMILSVLAKM